MKVDPIEELRLRAYPNPDRIGCPGPEGIEAFANKEIPQGDPRWDHLWHCSPCFAEFKVLRDARWERERRRFRRIISIAAAVAVIIGGFIFLQFGRTGGPLQQPTPTIGVLNFEAGAAERGAQNEGTEQQLPNSKGELRIILPKGSEPGDYSVQIRRADRMNVSIAEYPGKASTEADGRTMLHTIVDFSSLSRGSYAIAWQRIGAVSWDFGSFRVEQE